MKIGFIGCGNMASAIIGGIIKGGLYAPEAITASDASPAARDAAKEKFGIAVTEDNKANAGGADILFLSVKPQYFPEVIEEIKDSVRDETVVVSIAPGLKLEKLYAMFGRTLKIVRVMPNTPALVGEGMSGICPGELVTEAELKNVIAIFESCGKAEIVPEKLMDTVVAVSGSSPAYAFMFIEAMADAAVIGGMPRLQAYRFAAQAVLGSAKMVLETGKHPGELKDMVCSPAGTTIQAVRVLEDMGFRSAVIEASEACREKSEELG